jgi:hypothetical protein
MDLDRSCATTATDNLLQGAAACRSRFCLTRDNLSF